MSLPGGINGQAFDLRRCGISAADLIRLCDLELSHPEATLRTYKAMVELLGVGAEIWRDTDLVLPLVRERLATHLADRNADLPLLSDVWAHTVGELCHVQVPERLLNNGKLDLTTVTQIIAAWGIARLEIHPVPAASSPRAVPSVSWQLIGYGGVGRWTLQRMLHAVGPKWRTNLRSRMSGSALEGQLAVPAPHGVPPPPKLQFVIHGSSPADVAAGGQLLDRKTPDLLRHVVNIRPLGINPEAARFVSTRSIIDREDGPDYVWVIANHRQLHAPRYYDGLARSQVASRHARALITALADLCQTSYGNEIVRETQGARQLGAVGATRFLMDMSLQDLLLRALYSMLSPEWSFSASKRIICLWPRPLPNDTVEEVKIGNQRYAVEMLGVNSRNARADIRCLAFDIKPRPAGLLAYADYLVSVMAAWDWNLRSKIGDEMLFEEQGAVVVMLVADTSAMLDEILSRDRYAGIAADVIVTNRRPSRAQAALIETHNWPVIHHSGLSAWLQREFGEPGQMPIGERIFPVE